MPIQIVSGNLNLVCDSGNFESDPSTWNSGGYNIITSEFSSSRSPEASTKDLNSLKLLGNISFPSGAQNYRALNYSVFHPTANKKYICYCNVRTPSSNQFASDNCSIHLELVASGWTEISATPILISDCKDTWKQVVVMVSAPSSPASNAFPRLMIYKTSGSADDINSGGVLYIDQFEIYEYNDVAVVSNLDFTTTITTDSGAGDGSITVNASGGTSPYLYSLGGVAWQSSNVFNGLIGGYTYQIFVKDVTLFTVSKTVAVNMAAPPFSFTTTVTNESVVGGNDGQIVVIVTGTGAPFQYTKDSGYNWQSGNVFSGLPPGDYSVFVRPAGDTNVSHWVGAVVTVLAGSVFFSKTWWSRNHIIHQASAASGWQSLTNVRMYNDVQLFNPDDNSWSSIGMKVDLPVDANGNVVFYNRRAFDKILVANPPDKLAQNVIKLTDRIRFFRNNVGQLQDTDVTPASTVASVAELVMLGGLSKYQWAKLGYPGVFEQKFLTWAPKVKPVDKNQEDYLTYFSNRGTPIVTLKRKLMLYYDDGTTDTKTDVLVNGSAVSGDLYEFRSGPVGSGAIGYAAAAGKTLLKYDFSLLDQSDIVISDVRTYVLDAVSHPRKRLIMFLNSLGGYEVLRFTGAIEKNVVVSKNEVVKFLPYNYSATDGQFEMNDAVIRESDNLSSGYFTDQYGKDWLDYMKDLLLSKRVFDVTNGDRLPLKIQPATYPMGADQNYEYFVRFVAGDAYEDENYTPRVIS